MDILEKLNAYRAQEQQLAWEGRFVDYLDLFRKNPKIAETALPVYTI